MKNSNKKAPKKAEVKKEEAVKPLKHTKFYMWCKQKKITQKDIRDRSYIAYGCVNNMWHIGKTSKSTAHHMFLAFAKELKESKITFDKLQKMFTTFIDSGVE